MTDITLTVELNITQETPEVITLTEAELPEAVRQYKGWQQMYLEAERQKKFYSTIIMNDVNAKSNDGRLMVEFTH